MSTSGFRLRVDVLAHQHGIHTPAALSRATGLSASTCQRLWRGHAPSVRLRTLAALCQTLCCQPGDIIELSGRTVDNA